MPRLGFRERRQLKRELRRDLMEMRRINPDMSAADFKAKAEEYAKEEYEGIDPGNLQLILDFIKELLPMILALFSVLILFAFSASLSHATEFVVFATPEPVMAGEADAATDTTENNVATPVVSFNEACADGACDVQLQPTPVVQVGTPVRSVASRVRARTRARGIFSRTRSRSVFRGRLFGSCAGGR